MTPPRWTLLPPWQVAELLSSCGVRTRALQPVVCVARKLSYCYTTHNMRSESFKDWPSSEKGELGLEGLIGRSLPYNFPMLTNCQWYQWVPCGYTRALRWPSRWPAVMHCRGRPRQTQAGRQADPGRQAGRSREPPGSWQGSSAHWAGRSPRPLAACTRRASAPRRLPAPCSVRPRCPWEACHSRARLLEATPLAGQGSQRRPGGHQQRPWPALRADERQLQRQVFSSGKAGTGWATTCLPPWRDRRRNHVCML
jgi:hypothetical protein